MSKMILFSFLIFLSISCSKNSKPDVLELHSPSSLSSTANFIPSNSEEYNDSDFIHTARDIVDQLKNQRIVKNILKPFMAYALDPIACGSVITTSQTFSGTLDCSNYNGDYALVIFGDHINFNGGNTKLKIIFPQGKIGVLIYGSQNTLKNIEISQMTNGIGILNYDSPHTIIENNISRSNLIGLNIFADENVVEQVVVQNNDFSANSLFGIRTNNNGISGKTVKQLTLENNNLNSSGHYAFHLNVDELTIDEDFNNTILNSQNGFYLYNGKFKIENITLNNSNITKNIFMFYNADKIDINEVSITGNKSGISDESYAFHVYNSKKVDINNSNIHGFDVGIKVAVDSEVKCDLSLNELEIKNSHYAALILQSYDNTPFFKTTISDMDYDENLNDLLDYRFLK